MIPASIVALFAGRETAPLCLPNPQIPFIYRKVSSIKPDPEHIFIATTMLLATPAPITVSAVVTYAQGRTRVLLLPFEGPLDSREVKTLTAVDLDTTPPTTFVYYRITIPMVPDATVAIIVSRIVNGHFSDDPSRDCMAVITSSF
jgi:hypothetical protein